MIAKSTDLSYCEISQIYSEAASFKKNITLYTTFGDHNFLIGKDERNQNAFVNQIINWIENIKMTQN